MGALDTTLPTITLEQRTKILAYMDSGKLSSSWAQTLIDKIESLERMEQIINFSKEKVPPAIFWENVYPGKGRALMEVVGPLYDWTPTLAPPLPNLAERASKCVFWRDFAAVKPVSVSAHMSIRLENGLGIFGTAQESHDSIAGSSFYDVYRHAFPGNAPRQRVEALFRQKLGGSLRCRFWHRSGAYIANTLWDLFHVPSSLIAMGKTRGAQATEPLRAMLLAGNWPVGFDEEGNFIIFTA